ncbi:GNAT family N-acetyltransferase [Acerihabitans sp. TG2]|uniref:GNAT family N-acetyltransferase n=1 Tax=Acerihabitans sp. TG2 TaxID=3096008 RepID=UPI002B23EA92|nr:GNAT family N-acetyltransferase [Acerihabitans sp. TG2]MEA9390144.1 GNAT family N-acetyltransferase [Acerihabitans sp. TG2]
MAQPDDSIVLNTLGCMIYRAHFEHLWVAKPELDAFLESEYSVPVLEKSLADPDVQWFVAQTDKPIGFAKLTWRSPLQDTAISGALLNKLYLSPQETGKNYGRLMFEKIVQVAQEHGESYLWLEVLEQNRRARKFYDSLGMRHIRNTTFTTPSQSSILHILGIAI